MWNFPNPCRGILLNNMPKGYFPRISMQVRFWSKVVKKPGCWEWKASTDKDGYGQFWDSSNKSMRKAHRVSWEYCRGNIPPHLGVLHSCDNPPCTNPKHLSLGTHQENVRDSMLKCRRAKKLSHAQVTKIKGMLRKSTPDLELALRFGVSVSNIVSIRLGRIWKHVNDS